MFRLFHEVDSKFDARLIAPGLNFKVLRGEKIPGKRMSINGCRLGDSAVVVLRSSGSTLSVAIARRSGSKSSPLGKVGVQVAVG